MEEFNLGNQQAAPLRTTEQPFNVNGQFTGGQSDIDTQMRDIDFDAFTDLHFVPGTFPTAGVGQELESTANFDARIAPAHNVKFNPAPGAGKLHDIFTAPEKPTSTQLDVQKNRAVDDTFLAIRRAGSMQPEGVGADPNPINFSRKASNFDKYYESNAWDTTSFHPFANNTNAFADNMDWSDHNSLMWSQFMKMYTPALTSGWRAIGDMLGDKRTWIQGDYTGAKAFEDAMRIGGGGGFVNDLLLQSSYTMGVISSIALEELALALAVTATGGGAAPVAAARTGSNVVRGLKTIGQFGSRVLNNFGTTRVAKSSWHLLKDIRRVDNAKDFWRAGGRFSGSLVAPEISNLIRTHNATKNVVGATKGLATVSSTFGAFYRDFRALNLAIAESKLEAGMVHQDLFNNLYLDHKAKNDGVEPTSEEYDDIKESAVKGEFWTATMNAPFILLTNRMTLGVALSGFKGMAAMTAQAGSQLGRRLIDKKTVVAGVKSVVEDGGRQWWKQMYKRGAAGNFKQLIGGGLIYGQANIGEGIQELYQESVANGIKDYYTKVHNNPAIAGYEQILASTKYGAGSMMSGEGAHVFASGFLMGGVAMVPQKIAFQWMPETYTYLADRETYNRHIKERDAQVADAVITINKMANDTKQYFDVNLINSFVQQNMSDVMMQAGLEGNTMDFYDAKDGAIYHGLTTMAITGKSYLFREQMEDYLNLSDTDLENAFKAEIEKGSVEKVRTRIKEYIDRIDDVDASFKELNDRYINPYDPYAFKEGEPGYEESVGLYAGYQQVKMIMMFNRKMFERTVERYNKLWQEISSSKAIKNMDASDVDVLTNLSDLHNEINYLNTSLEIAQSPDVEVTESDYTMPTSIIEKEGKLGAQRPQETDKEEVKDKEGNIVQEASKGKDSNVVVKTGDDVIKGKDGEYKVSWTTYRDGTTTYTVSKVEMKGKKQVVVGKPLTQTEVDALFEEKTTTKAGEKVSEDEYLITLSDDERAMYSKQQERLTHLQKIFDIFTDENNILEKRSGDEISSLIEEDINKQEFESDEAKDLATRSAKMKYIAGSQESQFGFFDRSKTPKVRKAILDYLNFIAGKDNAIEDNADFDNILEKIIDYKTLKGRSIMHRKALNMLLNPQDAQTFGDKLGVSMLKAFRENREQVEARVKKGFVEKYTNKFLNDLFDIDVYPVDEEVKALLKDPEVIPVNYLGPSGLVTPRSDAKRYDQINDIVGQYRSLIKGLTEEVPAEKASTKKKESTKKGTKTLQETLEEINSNTVVSDAITRAEEKRKLNVKNAVDLINNDNSRVRILPEVEAVITRAYTQYLDEFAMRSDGTEFMTLAQWSEQGDVKAIARALSELYVVKALEEDTSEFGEWLQKNRKRADVEKIYKRKYDLSYGDIAVIGVQGYHAKPKPRQRVITDKSKSGPHILEIETIINEEGKQKKERHYRVVNVKGKPLSDTPYYELEDAKKERTRLSKKAKSSKGFMFEGKVVHTNDIVTDKDGTHYFIISKKNTFKTYLSVAPLDQINNKKITGGKRIKDGTFKEKGWKFAKDQVILKSTVKPEEDNRTKLSFVEPVNVVKTTGIRGNFPEFYNDRLEDVETAKEATARQQKMLRDLTPTELANLTVRIGKNPGWDKAEKIALEDRKTAKIFSEDYEENKQIKKHAQKYAIEVLNGDVSLGYMQGHTVMSLLDSNGDPIFPASIEEHEVAGLFRTQGRDLKKATAAIQNNYLQAQYIDALVEKLLKERSVSQVGATTDIKISDIKGVSLKLSKGSYAYANAKTGETPATFEELEYKFIDGKETYYVVQLRTDYSETSQTTKKTRGVTLTNAKSQAERKEYNAIYERMAGANSDFVSKHYGGYVAIVMLPNGTHSLVNLKAAPMTATQSDEIIERIKSQMVKTVEKNIDEDESGKPIAKDITFNHEFNDELIADVFIANKTLGTSVQLRVSPWGKLQVVFLNKRVHEDKKGKRLMFERSVDIPLNEFNFENTAAFINHVNKNIKDERLKAVKGSDEVLKVQWSKFTLALGADAFKVAIPTTKTERVDVVYQDHLLKAQTNLSSEVRKSIKLTFQVNDAIGLESLKTVSDTVKAISKKNSKKLVEAEQAVATSLESLVAAWLNTPEGNLDNQTVEQSAGKFAIEYGKRNSPTEGKTEAEITGEDVFNVVGQGLNVMTMVEAEINKQVLALETQQPTSEVGTSIADIERWKTEAFEKAGFEENIWPADENKEKQEEIINEYNAKLAALNQQTSEVEERPTITALREAIKDDDYVVPDAIVTSIAQKIVDGVELRREEVTLYNEYITKRVEKAKTNIEGKEEQRGEETLDKIERLKEELAAYKKARGAALVLASTSGDWTEAMEALKVDPKVIELTEEIDRLSSTIYKITKGGMLGHDVLDIEDFKVWMTEKLPGQFSVEEIDALGERLENNNMKLGEFVMYLKDASKGLEGIKGVIRVGKQTAFKKHESFHGVFRMLLTDAEIKRYLKLARREKRKLLREEGVSLKDALNELRRSHPAYAEMTRAMLEQTLYEEHLSDQFDIFKQDPSRVPVEMKSLFQKIIDAIRAILGLEEIGGLKDLYQGIESGIFANAVTRNNMFTRDLLAGSAVSANKILSIPMGSIVTTSKNERTGEDRVTTVQTYIPADIARNMIFLMSNTYMQRLSKSSLREDTLLDGTIDDVIQMYNIKERSAFYQKVAGSFDAYMLLYEELGKYHQALVDNRDLVKEAVHNHLGVFIDTSDKAVDDIEDSDEAQLVGLRNVGDYTGKDSNQSGGFSKMNYESRAYIAQTILTTTDDFGNTFLDPEAADKERVTIPVDHDRVFNLLIKAGRNSKDDTALIRKLALYTQEAVGVTGEGNNHTRKFVEKFFTDMGLTHEEVLTPGFVLPEVVANATLFQSIVNSLRLFRTDYQVVERDEKTGIHHVYDANKSDDEHAQIKIWASQWRKKLTPLDARDAIEELHGLLQGSPIQDSLTDKQRAKLAPNEDDTSLSAAAARIANSLNDDLGMNLSSTYIKFSIIANMAEVDRTTIQQDLYKLNKGKDQIEREDLEELLNSLEKKENPYKDYQDNIDEDTGEKIGYVASGVKGRVRKIALNNAQFDESVGESTWQDAEGNQIWGHAHSSFHMEMLNEINNIEWLESAKDDVRLVLNNLLNDPKFVTLVGEGGLRHIRAGGHRTGKLGMSDSGIHTTGGEGYTYGNQSSRDFLISMFSHALGEYKRNNPNKTEVLVVNDKTKEKFVKAPVFLKMLSDSNSIDLATLPVHKMVEKADDGSIKMTEKAIAMFRTFVQADVEQLIREQNPETKTKGIIKGYNEGENRSKTLFASASILDRRDGEIKSNLVASKTPFHSDASIADIISGKMTAGLMSSAAHSQVRIDTGSRSVVEFRTKDEIAEDLSGTYVAVKNLGLNTIDNINGVDFFNNLGSGFVSTTKPEGKKKVFDFYHDGVKYYTRSWNLVQFVNNKQSFYILKYNTNIEDETDVVEEAVLSKKTDVELEELREEKIRLEEFGSADVIEKIQRERRGEKTLDSEKRYTINTSVRDQLTARILGNDGSNGEEVVKPMTWEEAIKEKFKVSEDRYTEKALMLSLDEAIEEKQMQDLNDMMVLLHEQGAMEGLPASIKLGLREVQDDDRGGVTHMETDDTKALMPLFNFRASDRDFNIAQVILNQSVNARSLNELFTPNLAMSFKDTYKDFIKRSKSYHAAGPGFASETIDEESGIKHKLTVMDVITISDPQVKKLYNNLRGVKNFVPPNPSDNYIDSADGFMVMTSKAYRYTAYADGRLSKQEVAILDKIDKGDPLTTAEIRGSRKLRGGLLFTTSESAEKRKQWINKLLREGSNVTVISVDDIIAELQEKVEPSVLTSIAFTKAESNAVAALKAGKLVVFDSANETTEGIVLRDVITKNIKEKLRQDINVYHENIDDTKVEGLEGATKFNINAVENRGLKKLNGFLNSKKFVYADGQTHLKVSVFTLTKQRTSVRVGKARNQQTGKMETVWRAREGQEKWHILREKLEAHQDEVDEDGNLVRETIAMAVFESGSKMMKKNVMDHVDAFTEGVSITDNMNVLDARWMRRQLVNPSNKLEIVDAVQMKHKLPSEQVKNLKVTIGSREGVTIGEVMDLYHKTTNARIANKFFGRVNLVFTMETAIREIGKSKELGEASVNLLTFMDYAVNSLQTAKAKTQMLSFFGTENGRPLFNLNNPITEKKFEGLFLNFFSKGVLAERQTGISVALASSFGHKLIKKVAELDENGQPKRWDVIRSDVWEAMKTRNPNLKVQHKDFSNEEEQLFNPTAMKVGDYYLDVLRHDVMEYDSKGKETGIKYSEFIGTSHFRELDEWLLKNDGVIPPEMAKAYGIRIPSQDDHSAINLRMVDTLPAFYGSTAMFSDRLIEISGADFDIDKLYMQLAEFYYKKGKFHEFGKAATLKGQYKDYIRYTIKEYGNRKSNIFMATEKWSAVGENVPALSERTIESFNKKSGEEYTVDEILASDKMIKVVMVHQMLEEHDELSEEQINNLFKRSEDLRGGMEILGLPVTYNEYKKQRADKELKLDSTWKEKQGYTPYSEPYTGAHGNAILDYKMALLGNSGKTEPAEGDHVASGYQAADLVPLDEVLLAMEEDLPGLFQRKMPQNHDPFGMLGMGTYFKEGKEFSRGIGAIVAPNLKINVLAEHGISLISRVDNKGNETSKGLMINGTEYKNFVQKYALFHNGGAEALENNKEFRKQYVISAVITAMTDNGTNPIAGRLGIVKDALPTLATMVAMGVDIKTAIYMINHPSIELLYAEVGRKRKNEAGFDRRIKKRIDFIRKEVISEEEQAELGTPAVTTQLLIDHINKVGQLNPTESSIDAGYNDPATGSSFKKMDVLDAIIDLAVLEVYQKARKYTAFLRNASTIINITKGLGEDTGTMEDVMMAAEELGLELNDKDMKSKTLPSSTTKEKRPFDLRGIFKNTNTIQGYSYEIVKEFQNILLPKALLNQTDRFMRLRDGLINNINQRRVLRGEDKRKLSSEVTKYLNIKAYIQWLKTDSKNQKYLSSLNNGFIYDVMGSEFTIQKVMDEVTDYLKDKEIENSFINHVILLNTEFEDNRFGISRLFTNSWTTLPDSELIRLQNSMVDLYKDPKTRENVMHIIHYLLVKDGMQYSNDSFLNVVPSSLVQNQLNSIDKVHDLFLEDQGEESSGSERYDIIFGATFEELQFDLLKGYTTNVTNSSMNHQIRAGKDNVASELIVEELALGEGEMNIDYEQEETDTSVQVLSNRAKRSFPFKKYNTNHRYKSVLHAYEVLKGGSFNKKLFDKYRKDGGWGVHYKTKGKKENIPLLKQIIFQSIRSNVADIDLINALIENSTFTITEKSVLNDATIEILEQARELIVWDDINSQYASRAEVARRSKQKNELRKDAVRAEFLDDERMHFDFIGPRKKNAKSYHFVSDGKLTDKEREHNIKVDEELFITGLRHEKGRNKGEEKIKVHFPYVITVKAVDPFFGKTEFRSYELQTLTKSGESEGSRVSPELMNRQGEFWGLKATYKRMKHAGSRQQRAPGYAFAGVRPPFEHLRELEAIKDVERGNFGIGNVTNMGAFGSFSNKQLEALVDQKKAKELAFAETADIKATDRGYTVEQQAAMAKAGFATLTTEEEDTTEEKGTTKRMAVGWDEFDDTTEEEVSDVDRNNMDFLKKTTGEEQSDDSEPTSEDAEEIRAYLNSIGSIELTRRLIKFNRDDIEGLIGIFEDPRYQGDAAEFIAALKQMCK